MRFSRALVLFGAFAVLPAVARAQGRVIGGRVTDGESGQPLSDVQVVIKGTQIGAHTHDDGQYVLPTQTGAVTLTFRRIGYKAAELAVAATETSANVALTRDVLKLEETIVTGEATNVTRRNAANAVATVSADQLSQVQAQTLDQQLAGKVAGADIQQNSGAPGGGLQVRLRGASTIIGQFDPLYVIDGIIVSNNAIPPGTNAITQAASASGISSNEDNPTSRIADIDPNDIENIEILKGPSAAAIYGSKAANGVVLITTKRGRAGKTRINIAQRFGFSALSHELGSRTFDSTGAIAQFGSAVAPLFHSGVTYNHDEELAGHKPLSYQTTANIGGGTDATKYYASGINEYDGGIIDNTYFRKQSVSGSLDQSIGSKVQVGFNTSLMHTAAGRGLTNNDNVTASFYTAMAGIPSFLNLQANNNGQFPNNPLGPSNPLQTAALLHNDEGVYHGFGAFRGTWHVLEQRSNSLDLTTTAGVDYFQQQNSVYAPPSLQFEQSSPPPGVSVLTNSNNLNTNVNLNLIDRFTPGGFSATTSFGVEQETRTLNVAATAARGLSGTLTSVSSGTSVAVQQAREDVVDQGVFLQEEFLTLADRLLLTAGARADRSSNNANTSHLYVYPKAAASYRLPTQTSFLDEIKFRAAVGASGNEPQYGQKFGELVTANLAGLPTQQVKGSIAAPDLRPERSFEIEGGFDATLFHGRATLGVTGYQKRTTDLLLSRALAPSFGDTTEYFNAGVMRTRGIEVEASVIAAQGRNLNWTITSTFSKQAALIVELPVPSFSPGGFPTEFGTFMIEQGASPTQIVGNVTLANGTLTTGKIGDANPDYRVSLANNVTFRQLHLSFLFDASKGQDVDNLTELLYDFGGNTKDYADLITVGGKQVMKGVYRLTQWPTNTSVYVQDASYIKLREINISYDLPTYMLSPFGRGLHSASLSFSVRNLFTLTHYQGMDPEVSNFGNQAISRNVDVAPFPPSRTFWFGINLGL